MSMFLGLMLLLLAATTSPAFENNASHELKYRIKLSRHQISILCMGMGISVLSIILVLYHPSLVIIQGETIYPGVTAWSQGEQLL